MPKWPNDEPELDWPAEPEEDEEAELDFDEKDGPFDLSVDLWDPEDEQ